MDFTLPEDLRQYLAELDEFIEREIRPLEEQDDNIRFFDHRREDARTDWDRGGLPSREWEELLAEARRRADAAGHYRYAFPGPTAAGTAPTWAWRSSASTWPARASACTATCRTSTRSWATTSACC